MRTGFRTQQVQQFVGRPEAPLAEHGRHDGVEGVQLLGRIGTHIDFGGLPNKVIGTEYLRALPDEKLLAQHWAEARRLLQARVVTEPEGDESDSGEDT